MMARTHLFLLITCLGLLLSLLGAGARAETRALDETEMAEVHGGDGVGFAVHLEMNSSLLDGAILDSRLTAGFTVDGLTTYAVALNVGGIIDMFALTLDLRTRPDGGDYLDLGLPSFVGITQFGIRALAAQTDPKAAITNSYGQFMLNGHFAMTGHLYMWAQ
jgi:hypothetical protein